MSARDRGFSSQREAAREARLALWGDVSFAKRACLYPEPGTLSIVVSANVNGRLVAFLFDNYGRLQHASDTIVVGRLAR